MRAHHFRSHFVHIIKLKKEMVKLYFSAKSTVATIRKYCFVVFRCADQFCDRNQCWEAFYGLHNVLHSTNNQYFHWMGQNLRFRKGTRITDTGAGLKTRNLHQVWRIHSIRFVCFEWSLFIAQIVFHKHRTHAIHQRFVFTYWYFCVGDWKIASHVADTDDAVADLNESNAFRRRLRRYTSSRCRTAYVCPISVYI